MLVYTTSGAFRRAGRAALRGHWPLAVAGGFVSLLLIGDMISGIGVGARYLQTFFLPALFSILYDKFLHESLSLMAIAGVWMIIVVVLGGAMEIGHARFHLSLQKKRYASYELLFSEIHRIPRGFAMAFLRHLFIVLWALLLIFPGVIAAYSYAMMPYIMAEYPEVTASRAMDLSKEMMRGNKFRLFTLELSFIGWLYLSVLTRGAGFLFLRPYIRASEAAFYCTLKDEGYLRGQLLGPN